MRLDDNVLRKLCEDLSKKKSPAISEPELVSEYLKFIQMNNELMNIGSAYDIASIIRSYDFWYGKKDAEPKTFYVNPKEVYYVDLGAFNLKYEEGFLHSCVVIKKYGTMVLVVPGSTKKYGKKHFLIENVSAGDGFIEDTGVMIDQLRCVSITRIRGKIIGTMTDPTFSKIENKIFEAYLCNKFKENEDLKHENENLKKEIDEYKETIEKLKQDISNNIE